MFYLCNASLVGAVVLLRVEEGSSVLVVHTVVEEELRTEQVVCHIEELVKACKEELVHTGMVVVEIADCIWVEETSASELVHFDMLTYSHDTWPCQWAGTEEVHSHR